MVETAIKLTMGEINTMLAGKHNVSQGALNIEMADFAKLSARVSFGKNEIDFELIDGNDTPETIEAKFEAYLDTECMDKILEAREALRIADSPSDIALAPEPPTKKN